MGVVITRVMVVHARQGIGRSEALRYWKEVHASVVAKVPALRRYVQNHCIERILGTDGSTLPRYRRGVVRQRATR